MPIYINAVVEDRVHAAIVKRLLQYFGCKYKLLSMDIKNGHGALDNGLAGYNQAARSAHRVYFVLRDFDALEDRDNCPQGKIASLLGGEEKADNLLFRMAVAEGENWLLADYVSLYNFLGIKKNQENPTPDRIRNGREKIFAIARRSRNREYREAIVPQEGERLGYNYNGVMEEFILNHWKPEKAAKNSKSLRRTMARLKAFTP